MNELVEHDKHTAYLYRSTQTLLLCLPAQKRMWAWSKRNSHLWS